MENGSTANKRRSLTLSSRLLQKRHSASPKNQSVRASATQEAGKDVVECYSPKASSVEYVESTPPSKMTYSLDDSLDYSPRHNLSPSCLFSQTLTNGSPEVSWRWNRDKKLRGDNVNTTNDSGFDSEELGSGVYRQHKDQRKQVRANTVNEHRRKQLEKQNRRAQQIRDHELLKERCDKLHRQLDQQATAADELDTQDAIFAAAPSVASTTEAAATIASTTPTSAATQSKQAPVAADAALVDFLNDSVTDSFLLEATQELEPKLAPKNTSLEATTPTSHHNNHKEKRSSFYMKFLDESESEDWFVALDEAVLEASQAKKPRTSLQRYKSMPSNTAVNIVPKSHDVTTCITCPISSPSTSKAETTRIKRHASSHVLSPASEGSRTISRVGF